MSTVHDALDLQGATIRSEDFARGLVTKGRWRYGGVESLVLNFCVSVESNFGRLC